jgi:hypothetical protein
MSQEHAKQETIHDEIEAEVSHNTVVKRSVWKSLGWKIAALIIVAGAAIWFARAHEDLGPIHTTSASVK